MKKGRKINIKINEEGKSGKDRDEREKEMMKKKEKRKREAERDGRTKKIAGER